MRRYRKAAASAQSKQKHTTLAVISILLCLGSVTTAVVVVVQRSKRVEVIGISKRIEAGQPIPNTAMEKKENLSPTGLLIPWAEHEHLGGMVTTVTVLPGTLLTRAMTVSATTEHVPGKAMVGLNLKQGQLPDSLSRGSRVRIIQTPPGSSVQKGRVLVESARVESMDTQEATRNGHVTVVVDDHLSPEIAMYASRGEITIKELPAQHGPAS
jgi:hypothetical protein